MTDTTDGLDDASWMDLWQRPDGDQVLMFTTPRRSHAA